MFLKIVPKDRPYSHTYHCTKYGITDMKQADGSNVVRLLVEAGKDSYEEFFNYNAKMYVMNDSGKTIDTIIFDFPAE